MTETRKEFEERLLTELLQEPDMRNECLSNILSYAAGYLRSNIPDYPHRSIDLKRADLLDKYADQMAERIQEVR